MNSTPLAERIKIVLTGMRNSGKSSLLNNIFQKEVAIVSDKPGTTTDPVTRPYELIGIGPVSFTDTAGMADEGDLGKLRMEKTRERINNADIVLFVTPLTRDLNHEEKQLLKMAKNKQVLIVETFADSPIRNRQNEYGQNSIVVSINNLTGEGLTELLKELKIMCKSVQGEPTPVEGLVQEMDTVLLVTPIDLAAPKGRLILPQVETIRDLLDRDCGVMICKERELLHYYNQLKSRPKLVITDSQAFHSVAADIPPDQPLTSFSILFARKKGELSLFLESLKIMDRLPKDAKILILESCSHHRQADDIGTVKIPRLIRELAAPLADITFSKNVPDDTAAGKFDLVISCGGCMISRNAVLSRQADFKAKEIPLINYGLFLAWANGLFPRAVEPFPECSPIL